MADPISIVKSIISLLATINKLVATFHTNQEDCCRIRRVVATAQATVEPLKQMPKVTENMGMNVALKELEEALQRSTEVIESCKKKNFICRRIQANNIAGDLHRVYKDISANIALVNLASSIYNGSMLAVIMKILAHILPRDYDSSMLAKASKIIAAHPHVHLRRAVEQSVHAYCGSTEHASDQNKKERKTYKTSEVKNEKDNVPAADITVPRASLSHGDVACSSTIQEAPRKEAQYRPSPRDGHPACPAAPPHRYRDAACIREAPRKEAQYRPPLRNGHRACPAAPPHLYGDALGAPRKEAQYRPLREQGPK
ncbi:hypothetical protein BS78_05G234300 [Paspalum vaginatum]|nr:hypothetical protein BS78_05G234300 [Paspalum vaginatum]